MSGCRMPGCCETVYGRGLCNRHYQRSLRLLKRDPEAHAALVEAGIILPSRRNELADLASDLLAQRS